MNYSRIKPNDSNQIVLIKIITVYSFPGTCRCLSGYYVSNNNTECTPYKIGDSNCLVTSNCNDSVANSDCVNSTCTCNPGHQVSDNMDQCILRQIGDPCNESSECSPAVGNSTCSNMTHTCSCPTEFYSSNNNSECTLRQIEDSCDRDAQCSEAVTNSLCRNDTCSCEDGYKVTSNLDKNIRIEILMSNKTFRLEL